MAASTKPALAPADEVSPSFSDEYFAIELMPLASGVGLVSAVLLSGAPASDPSAGRLVDALQNVTAVSLTIWTAAVVMLSIVVRPISRVAFDVLTSGIGVLFPERLRWFSDLGPWFPLGRSVDSAVDDINDQVIETSLTVPQMKALLIDSDQRLIDRQRYTWECATRMCGYLFVAAVVCGVLVARAPDSGDLAFVVFAVLSGLSLLYYRSALRGQREATQNLLRGYHAVRGSGSAETPARQGAPT